ncbi:coiled-coil domain-containing protein 12 [Tribolium castaneum]|nr:PREDICTED: coiled-coil domain-containing protein 12 [Tribolium castaneum]|eukprot:XP_972150.2 PREDICTED: coiled-coil domain-containing protein 12 [Tribolium castaneum]
MTISKSEKMSEEVNSLEEQARKRQERLKSLKRKREDKSNDTKSDQDAAQTLPTPKFRSYRPQDKNLNEHLVTKRESIDVRNEVKDLLDLAKGEMVIDQLDISSLAPRQPDWDLKRDVEKKLEKLAKRTQKAMAELIREKLKAKQDLAEVSNAPVDM